MKKFLIIALLLFSMLTYGQKINKWHLNYLLQPELTYHENDYAFRWKEKYTKSTFNIGMSVSAQYNITNRFFAEAGLGFISRKLNAIAFLSQSALPPPHYDSMAELVTTKSISLRTIELPFNLGYNFFKTTNCNLFIKTGISPNFLLNSYYNVFRDKYRGTYQKNYWQGYSLNASIGIDYKVAKKITAVSFLSYSFINTVTKDTYLFSQDEYTIALPHKYLRLQIGIKAPF